MAEFIKALPEWNDPGVEPAQEVKDSGWKIAQRPPASYFDWFQYTTYQALKELQESSLHVSKTGDLSTLETTEKNTLIGAINEVKNFADGIAEGIEQDTKSTDNEIMYWASI